MKLRIVLNNNRIRNFLLNFHMLIKQAEEIIFISSKNKITLMTERPLVWIDINVSQYAESYDFSGEKHKDGEEYIYTEIKSSKVLLPTEAFGELTEISLVKSDSNTPFLKVFSKQETTRNSFETLVPIIIIPIEQWDAINIPQDISYDSHCKLPRYYILRKYIDIYKFARSMRIFFSKDKFMLEAGNDVESQVMTTFNATNKITDDKGRPMQHKVVSIVDSKKISAFFHSIHILNLSRPKIMGRIKLQKYFKVDFKNEDNAVTYNAIFEALDDEEYNTNIYEIYREEAKNFDAVYISN